MRAFGTLILALLLALALFACDAADDSDSEFDAASETPAQDDDDADDNEATDEPAGRSGPTIERDCEPVAPEPWPDPDFADPAEVAFDDNLFFTVDDQRFFPLGYYGVPRDEESLETFKEEGFNIALTGPGCCGSGTQPQIDWLRLAQQEEIFVIMHPWSSSNDVLTRPEEDLEQELIERNDVGSLFGWYTFDEPALHRPSKELTERMHYILSTYSADHPDCLVEQTMDDFNLYVDDCAFFMIDPYPLPYMFINMVKYSMLEAEMATEGEKPIVGVMQSFSWEWYEGNWDAIFHPNGAEMRNMAWQFIIFGARGLIPWKYTGDYTIHAVPDIWSDYLETVAEMNELMGVILADEADIDLAAETTFPNSLDYVVKQDETATWVFSVSTNEHGLYVEYDLSALGDGLCVVDYTTGEIFEQDDDGKIRVKYDALQVRVLEIMEN